MNPKASCGVLNPPLRGIVQLANSAALRFRNWSFNNKMDSKTIIIGYGNIDRADDGVAFAVINELRRQLGQKMLEEGDTGLDELNDENDSIFLSQLVPEIMELLTGYNRIIFVDAHVGADTEDLNCSPVLAQYISSSFTHHMTPSALLAFLQTMYQCEPQAHIVSIRGYDFDFKRTFSPKVQALVQPAVNAILKLMNQSRV